ncbi:MAG: endonuclease/exonuclease/phosphatase family protein [Clostridia bacterium]|nr:endonuclease/exonuclease/phosphatase family protein [Clostridia bacterium]
MKLRVMTYNIQHAMEHAAWMKDKTEIINFDMIADVIKRFNPDVVGLNEVRDRGADADYREQTLEIAKRLGYEHCYFAKAFDFGWGPYGNAIISKYPMAKAWTVPIPDPVYKTSGGYYEPRCILKAEFEAPTRFDVLISHFGLPASEQRNAVSIMMQLLETREVPTVVMGDFNMRPDNPTLAPLLGSLKDTAELLPEGTMTFPSEDPKIKIDYLLVSEDITPISAESPAIIASDHCPYFAELEL